MIADAGQLRYPIFSDVRAMRARKKLAMFVREAWHVIEPATELVWNWHLDAICDHVQALYEGTLGKRNLIINVPPGTMKSTCVSVCVLPWIWLQSAKGPQRGSFYRGIFAAGAHAISSRDAIKCRIILDSEWYRKTFDVRWYFRPDQNQIMRYMNSRNGFRYSTTAGSLITGERGDGLWVDDPLDAQQAFSEVDRKRINERWWDQTFANRLNNPDHSTRCIIAQRLHEEDLPGHILEKEGTDIWETLILPMQYDPRRSRVTSLGFKDPRTEAKELLFPARFSEHIVALERIRLGSSGFAGQMQQLPSAAEGEIFKREFVRYIDPKTIKAFTQTVISWDTATKERTNNDWSVSIVGKEFDKGILLSERIHARMAYPQLREATKLQAARVGAHALLIEDTSAGQALIQEIQQYTQLPVVAVNVSTDKVARAWVIVPSWEAGRIWLPCDENGEPEPWCEEFLSELCAFPKAAHDDQVDAFTQLCHYLLLAPGARGLIDWYKSQMAADQAKLKKEREEDAVHHRVEYINMLNAANGGKPS